MISHPTCSRLLDVVREELRMTVAGAITDASVGSALAMIDEVLRAVAVRCDNEIAWMLEEIDVIEALAERVVASDVANATDIADGLSRMRSAPAVSMRAQDVATAYSAASHVLSRCVEVVFPIGGEVWRDVEAALEQRLDHEAAIQGQAFALVARG
jgi:hypothetical protein